MASHRLTDRSRSRRHRKAAGRHARRGNPGPASTSCASSRVPADRRKVAVQASTSKASPRESGANPRVCAGRSRRGTTRHDGGLAVGAGGGGRQHGGAQWCVVARMSARRSPPTRTSRWCRLPAHREPAAPSHTRPPTGTAFTVPRNTPASGTSFARGSSAAARSPGQMCVRYWILADSQVGCIS